MTVEWLTGDALEHTRALPDASIDLVATSPPFLALRNYNNLDGQWGSEATPAAFLDNLLDLVEALGPKLAGHGSIAFELGDTYAGGGGVLGGWGMRGDPKGSKLQPAATKSSSNSRLGSGAGWPLAKSLTGVPTLFAWSLAYGRNLLRPERTIEPWRIRNVIVWARANPPVGALGDKYRPATSYITVATKSGKRWFDLDAVRTPLVRPNDNGQRRSTLNRDAPGYHTGDENELTNLQNPAGAPPLDHCNDTENLTWHINTHGSSLAHYAMWPPTLAERLILSMSPPGGHVLDPFAGTGTTLAVADIHGRQATGIDLDPHNPDLYEARYAECWRALKPDAGPSPVTPHGEQLSMI